MLPEPAGVYRLEHQPSGYVYVGSTTRLNSRKAQWRANFRHLRDADAASREPRYFRMSPRFHAIARGLSLSGWSFVVVELVDLEQASVADLHAAELAEIGRLNAASPELLLNVIKTTRPPSYLQSRFKGAGARLVSIRPGGEAS